MKVDVQVKSPNSKTKKIEKPKVPSLQKLVSKNPHFSFLPNGKIKCDLTGHEMEPVLEKFKSYLNSKSYKRGLESQYDISEYEKYLVEYKNNNRFLFCQLTGAKVARKRSVIEKHVMGKKFRRRLEESS